MKRIRSMGCLAVALTIAFSSLLSGCSGESKVREKIIATVDSYLAELESGDFAKSGYASSYAKDNPFSSLIFADEGVRSCLDTALENITYEVTEVNGDTQSKTGVCTLSVTVPDLSKTLEDLEAEWVTPELLSDAIAAEDSATVEYEVSLQMEYDSVSEKWMIADSSELANAMGVPYSELNLYSEAGDPRVALTTFLEDLAIGKYADVAPFLQTTSAYSLLFPDEVDLLIRQTFFEQMQFEIQDMTMTDAGCEIEVLLDHIDLQVVSDRLAQSADLSCEMFKLILPAFLTDSEITPLDNYDSRYLELSLKEMAYPDALRLQETFVFQLEPSVVGQQWQIVGLPSFMTTTEYESEPAADQVQLSALGMALIELYDEGIITKTILDEQLQYYGIEGLKYSSRKVVASLVNFSFIDLDTLEEVESYSSTDTYQLCYMLEFDQDWPDLTYHILVFDDASGDVIYSFDVATDTPYPSIYAGTIGDDGLLWSPGTYTLVFVLEDSTLLASMSIEIA